MGRGVECCLLDSEGGKERRMGKREGWEVMTALITSHHNKKFYSSLQHWTCCFKTECTMIYEQVVR